MTHILTPGRWFGLKQTAGDDGVFAILAFDQRGSYEKMLPAGATYADAVQIKREVIAALTTSTSAVLLDAVYGLEPALYRSRRAGLLVALEESGYTGDSTYRGIEFNPHWTVEKIKRMGANAVKLLAYYHPYSGALAEEIEGVVQRVVEECHRFDLPVFVEPISYSLDASIKKESATFAAQRPEIVVETARRLSRLKVDVLKMEFPVDASFDQDEDSWRRWCAAISEVSDVPWVLLSAGVDFETFERQTRAACQNGASGWLAGRAIWREVTQMDAEGRETFLRGVALERVLRLSEIASASARRWTEFYTPISGSANWYESYGVGE